MNRLAHQVSRTLVKVLLASTMGGTESTNLRSTYFEEKCLQRNIVTVQVL